ncbi:MAG: TetR/AcrR family transcriptional regulator [Acutalibacteraceae bacterium]
MKTEATKQKIQETFFSLSQTMPMKKITVSKLCQACQISRSTFYLHYDNVDDLTEYLEKELLYRIEKLLKRTAYSSGRISKSDLFHLLTYIDSHLSEFQFLISKQDSAEFIARLSNIIENSLTNRLQVLGYHIETYKLAISFAASGILNLMISQIKQNLPETKQMICFTYNELIYAILKHKVKTSSTILLVF